MGAGDGAAIDGRGTVSLTSTEGGELLLFDLPA
jgi:hypothetical protein